MTQAITDWVVAYLQDDPEHLAAIIVALFVWNCINTLFIILVSIALDSTHGALRRLTFKVMGRFDLE